jgi:hypothetical protein
MAYDWTELTRITRGAPFTVERVRMEKGDVAIEGSFELPPLARLTIEDQVFITAFIKCHGSIKEMEGMFGISYPTVKNRLNRIAGQLEFVEIVPLSTQEEILDLIEDGELTVEEAIEKLGGVQ